MKQEILHAGNRGQVTPGVLLRTRRSVMEAAHLMQTRRVRQRRHAGIALLAISVFLVLFAPAIWSVANDLSDGEHFFEMPVIMLTLSLLFLAAMFAILLMMWRDRNHGGRDE